MSVETARGRLARHGWFALLALCLLPCLASYSCRLDPTAVLAKIPVGSKLSELDKYLGRFYDGSSVQEWVPDRTAATTGHRTTPYGVFYVRELRDYDAWPATQSERDAFTGELSFYHHSWVIPDDLAPSYVFSLVYVHGVLKEKEYGQMPG